jgi:roadblock/LC7 domain-containing protein
MLKRLQKYKAEKPTGISALSRDTFSLFLNKYKIQGPETAALYNGKMILAVEFSDADMDKVVKALNSESLPQQI